MNNISTMTSNGPYLLRALYEWINHHNLTPYVLADAMRAVASLEINNHGISFMARFSGKSQSIFIPIEAVIAIYAQETGQGMMLPPDESQAESHEYSDSVEQHESESGQEQQRTEEPPKPPTTPNPPKGSHLRIVK